MRNFLRSLLIPFALLLSCPAFSLGFYVSDIQVNGLQRVDARSVFAALPINIGDKVDDAVIAGAAKALFNTGNFNDIKIKRDNDVLIIQVEERPAISSIKIHGNKSIGTDQLMEALKRSGLKEGEIFKRATLERIHLELERQYLSQGRYGAKVTTKTKPKKRNRVAVQIEIAEGDIARIQHISIVGNKAFSDAELLSQLELKVPGYWSFFSKDDQYAREKLSADLETLRSYYLDRGYANFQIESTQVSVSPDKQDVYIAINISEGEKYKITSVKLAGDLPLPEEKLKQFVLIRSGFYFSNRLITMTNELLTKQLGNEGYVFAKVNGMPAINEKDKTVDVTFYVDAGQRNYVRRINFVGNTKTSDEVLRREMRQMEGAWASGEKIEFSKVRLNRLGFFKEVNVETPRVPGSEDEVDVNYTVEEGTFGELTASIGYSDGVGAIISGSLSQNNFLGTGNRVSVSLSRSAYQDDYNITYNNPYYTIDGVSRGFNVFYRRTDYQKNNGPSTVTNSYGGSVTYGYPIDENQRLSFSMGYSNTEIVEINKYMYVVEVRDFLKDQNDFNIYTTTGSWNWSTLNRGLFPDRGASQSAQLQVSVPQVSDLEFYKLTYDGQVYVPVQDEWALRFRTQLGYGDGYGGTVGLPFFQNFRAGGFGSVRGYRSNTLGPKSSEIYQPDPLLLTSFNPSKSCIDFVTRNGQLECLIANDPFGGNLMVEGTIELVFPTPFVKDKRSVRTAFFVDSGNVFDTHSKQYDLQSDTFSGHDNSLQFSELRYSAGVGLTWMTAIAPLSFVIAEPINSQNGDRTRTFQFDLGRVF